MTDFIHEVDEEYRRSQAEQMWKRFGPLLIAACVLIVAGVAVWRYMDWQQQKAAQAAGAQFDAALQNLANNRVAEGEAALKELSSAQSGIYRALAQLRAASELAKRDAGSALKSFDQLAGDAALDATFRDIARLRAGALAADLEPLAEVERRLQPLTSGANPWRHQALELIAAAAMKANNTERARQALDQIILDREAPAGVRSRAELLIGLTR